MILKLAWRNLWRNWRRSVITLAAVTFAVTLSLAMMGIQDGTYDYNIEHSLNMFTGYAQIQHKNFIDNPTIRNSFYVNQLLVDSLKNMKEVKGFARRITSFGLVGYKNNSNGGIIIGIEPKAEASLSKIKDRVRTGTFLSDERIYDVVVGQKMLNNMGINIGDTIVILSQGYDGTTGNLKFRVCGGFKMGVNEMDAMGIFMNIRAADELLNLNGKITNLVLFFDSRKSLDKIKTTAIPLINDKKISFLNWDEVIPELKQTQEMDNISNYFFMGILILIVGFGILNTVLMSITERFREMGVLLAVGIRNFQLMIISFVEVLWLTLLGLISGSLFGYLINIYFVYNPIRFTGDYAYMMEELGFVPELHSAVNPEMFIIINTIFLLISFLVFIYPAYRIYKLEALKGIRYT